MAFSCGYYSTPHLTCKNIILPGMRKNFSDLALFLRRARKGVDQPNTAHAPRQTYAACCAGRGRSGSRSERRVLPGRRQSGIAQLWIPIGPAPLRREVEQIPLWVDGIVVAGILPRIGRHVEELGAPEVADHFAVAPEYVEHRHLGSLRVLAEVVAVVNVAG